MEELAALPKEEPAILLFDAFDNAEETTQNWLFEHFITRFFTQYHMSGLSLQAVPFHRLQSLGKTCATRTNYKPFRQKSLRNYCDQIGVDDELTDDRINEFHYIFDGKPGLFANLVLPSMGNTQYDH